MKERKDVVQIDCMSEDVVLIITACIQPNQNQRYLSLKNVEERLHQYIACIEFYLAHSPFHHIVFCDNSNYTIEETAVLMQKAKDAGKSLEMLRFMGNSDLVAKFSTKGIGEDEIMDYVLTNSILVSRAKTIIKVTGRLLITNTKKLVDGFCYGKNYFLRDIYSDTRSLDTRFFAMDVNSYNLLLRRCYERTNDYDMSYERVFFQLLQGRYSSFCCYPRFVGRSSGVGTNYGAEPKAKLYLFDVFCSLGVFNKDVCFFCILYANILLRKVRTLINRIKR